MLILEVDQHTDKQDPERHTNSVNRHSCSCNTKYHEMPDQMNLFVTEGGASPNTINYLARGNISVFITYVQE